MVGTGELEAILAAAGVAPSSASPFNILPQDFDQPSIAAHTEAHLTLLEGGVVNETTVGMEARQDVPQQQMVHRAASAVSQHSHPTEIAPQLAIAASLAVTGTTGGHDQLACGG